MVRASMHWFWSLVSPLEEAKDVLILQAASLADKLCNVSSMHIIYTHTYIDIHIYIYIHIYTH